jgi:hypothetical protein
MLSLTPLALMLFQEGIQATRPTFFAPVFVGLLVAGGVAWLIASVLGFARARAFGASTRWFSYAAVCLLLYHIYWFLVGFVAILGAQQNNFDTVLNVGAFLNVFVVVGAICAILGFLRLTNPR